MNQQERISVSYHYKNNDSSNNNQNQAHSSNITEIPTSLENFLTQSRILDHYTFEKQADENQMQDDENNLKYVKVLELCSQFINKQKEIFLYRDYECCTKHFFRQKVFHKSEQISSMTVEFPRRDCFGKLSRCLTNLFFEHKEQLSAASSLQDSLRIQVFGKAKMGLVTIGGIPIGRFEAVYPSVCKSFFCNASIQVEVEAFYGEKSQITIERDANNKKLFMETLLSCICCSQNTKQMRIFKNGNQVNTFSIDRSCWNHFIQIFCSSCINAKWEVTQMPVSTNLLSDLEKVLIIAAWLYQIEEIK